MRHGLREGLRVIGRTPQASTSTARSFCSPSCRLGTGLQWLPLPSLTNTSATLSPQIITDISPLSTCRKALSTLPSLPVQQKRSASKLKARTLYKRFALDNSSLAEPGRMKSHVQILTTPTADTPGTGLMLILEHKRYFFGQAHEGLQRAGLERGARFIKLKEIFLTGTSSTENVGGLFGMILTTADALKCRLESDKENLRLVWEKYEQRAKAEAERKARGKRPNAKNASYLLKPPPSDLKEHRLGIHGPPNLKHFIATARGYIFRQEIPLDVEEFTDSQNPVNSDAQREPTWTDENIRVWAIALSPGVECTSPPPASGMGYSKKRSLGEYMGSDQDEPTEQAEKVLESKDQVENQTTPDKIIHEMFQSNWRSDQFDQKRLSEVSLPAKLFVRNPVTKKMSIYQGPLPGGTEPVPDINVFIRRPWPGQVYNALPQVKQSKVAMSYIMRTRKQRGKFKPDLAKSFGIKPGPAYSDLANGKTVVSPTGKLVTPEMVVDPGKEGAGFVLIDLPSKEYIPAFIQRPEWDDATLMEEVKAFIWILGPGVAGEESILKFMKDHTNQKHIVSSPDLSPNYLAMRTAAVAAVHNQMVDPARFATLRFSNEVPYTPSEIVEGNRLPLNAEIARAGLNIHLTPLFEIRDDEVGLVDLGKTVRFMPYKVQNLIKKANRDVANAERAQNASESSLPFPDAEIICLGTGSAAPSQYRNVAGTLLRIPGHGSYLFDAGENTLGQLRRKYSQQGVAEILRDLKMIWNSHLHADHHLGIIPIIKAWHEEVHRENLDLGLSAEEEPVQHVVDRIRRDKCLFVVCGPDLRRSIYERGWTEPVCHSRRLLILEAEYASSPDFKDSRLLYGRDNDLGLTTGQDDNIKSAMRNGLGLSNLVVCPLSHCARAMAISISFANGFKFSYSGDCRPARNFAEMGRDSTVLVHEATFDDELWSDAIAKRHSTISEAIQMGVRMKAKNVILTHFSQRFSKIPSMDEVVVKKWASPQSTAQDEDVDETPMDEAPLDDIDLSEQHYVASGDVQSDYQPRIPESDSPLVDRVSSIDQNDQLDNLSPSRLSYKEAAPSAYGKALSENPTLPQNSNTPSSNINIAVAFDHMSVKVKDIQYLKHFIPAFCELYKDEGRTIVEAQDGTSLPNEEAGVGEEAVVDAWDSRNPRAPGGNRPPKGIEKVRGKEARKAEKRRMLEEQRRGKDEAKAKRNELHQQQRQAERRDVDAETQMDVDAGRSDADIPAAAVGTMSVSGR